MEQKLTFEELPNEVRELRIEVRELKRLIIEKSNKSPEPSSDTLFTVGEAAKFLSLSPSTIYGLVHEGKIPHMKPAKHLYFAKSDLLEYLQKNKRKSAQDLESDASTFVNPNRQK